MSDVLPSVYQTFIHKSRYARWLDNEGRRENWNETVERYLSFMWENTPASQFGKKHPVFDQLKNSILNLEVMP